MSVASEGDAVHRDEMIQCTVLATPVAGCPMSMSSSHQTSNPALAGNIADLFVDIIHPPFFRHKFTPTLLSLSPPLLRLSLYTRQHHPIHNNHSHVAHVRHCFFFSSHESVHGYIEGMNIKGGIWESDMSHGGHTEGYHFLPRRITMGAGKKADRLGWLCRRLGLKLRGSRTEIAEDARG